MKSTGIVRKVDELGRVVLPIELRRNLGIEEKDPLEIYINGEEIILRKYSPGCACCKEIKETETLQGVSLCHDCIGLFLYASSESRR